MQSQPGKPLLALIGHMLKAGTHPWGLGWFWAPFLATEAYFPLKTVVLGPPNTIPAGDMGKSKPDWHFQPGVEGGRDSFKTHVPGGGGRVWGLTFWGLILGSKFFLPFALKKKPKMAKTLPPTGGGSQGHWGHHRPGAGGAAEQNTIPPPHSLGSRTEKMPNPPSCIALTSHPLQVCDVRPEK